MASVQQKYSFFFGGKDHNLHLKQYVLQMGRHNLFGNSGGPRQFFYLSIAQIKSLVQSLIYSPYIFSV